MGVLRGVERRARIQHRIMNGERNPFTGPMSKHLWEQAHSVPSQYHDIFDYSVYDHLYERFGDQQPRGAWCIRTR
jgi:hypothetical protein